MASETTTLLGTNNKTTLSSSSGDSHSKDPLFLRVLLVVCYTALIVYSITVMVGPLLLHMEKETQWCNLPYEKTEFNATDYAKATDVATFPSPITPTQMQYLNPDYNADPCVEIRLPQLLGLTLTEANYCRRLFTSAVLGGVIGYERRSAERPAGIRTMALVSLGACSFTLSAIAAFASSPMIWDSSRVSAALPSGVGFLGGALIWKGKITVDGKDQNQVHGLTTAASVWFSAAVGIGAGGALYFVAIYSTVMVLLMLRFGPTLTGQPDEECDDEDDVPVGPLEAEMKRRRTLASMPTFES